MTGPLLGPADLVARVDEAMEVEAEALARPVDALRRAAYQRHATYPGYAALGVVDGGALVGLGYGYRDAPGQWWHEQIAPALVARGLGWWLHGCFVVVELHLRPAYQGRGLGKRMLLELVRGRPEPGVMLSTDDLDTPARRLYRRVGMTDLVTGFQFSTVPRPYAIMGARLPLGGAPAT